jgi:hypothetical protein
MIFIKSEERLKRKIDARTKKESNRSNYSPKLTKMVDKLLTLRVKKAKKGI